MNANQIKALTVRVLDFSPRFGSPGERLITILDRCPDLLDLNIKIGIGMKVLDTVPWISREFSQLSASIPPFYETGWFDTKVPLYVLLLNEDSGLENPIQSWCFGQFEYKLENHMEYPTPQSFSLTNYNLSTPTLNPNFVGHNMNTGLQMHYSANVPPALECFSLQEFNQQFEADSSTSSRAHSLSQQVLQRVDSSKVVSEQEPTVSEPGGQEITNLPYSTPLVTPANTVVPPFLNDLFFFPTYQPRLRMSTYTTHLRSSLESANYFPQTLPTQTESQFWLLQPENQNEAHCNEHSNEHNNEHCNEVTPSSFNVHTGFLNENVQDCPFELESNQTNLQLSQVECKPTKIPETSSIQTNEPVQSNPTSKDQLLSNRENKETKSLEITPPIKRRKNSVKPNCDNTHSQLLSKVSNEKENSLQLNRSFVKVQPRLSTFPITRKSSDSDVSVATNEIPSKTQPHPHPLYRDKPFHGVLNRADLVLSTDISIMVKDWTPEEIQAGRRLLRFQRRHEENTLYCQFEPISYKDYLNLQQSTMCDDNSTGKKSDIIDQMVISVILWSGPSLESDGPESETSYYITSVDLVNLLEGLLGVVFTLEEKNRIRRNMELFNPITVGKGTDRTGDLFRRIMAFPAPRPRNIEKGIKVFPFDRLPQALRKVVGKHTASRSSTVKVNLLPLETPSFS